MILTSNRPATKMIWGVDLRSLDSINRAGGVLTGAPKVDSNGLHLDGATQYGTFPLTQELNRNAITFKIVFAPDFEIDAASRVFFDSTGDRFLFYKDALDKLSAYLYGTLVFQIAYSTWGPYWKTGQRNVIVVTAQTSGGSSVYLNGYSIGSSATILTNSSGQTKLFIGAANTPAPNFLGTIHELSIYEGVWTPDEASRSYRHSLWNYRSRASLYLDMKDATVDRSGTYRVTTDRSKYGRLVTLGDGFTAAGIPAFQNKNYSFDGTNDYMLASILDSTGSIGQSFVAVIQPNFPTNENANRTIIDTTARDNIVKKNNAGSNVLQIVLGNTTIASITETTYKPYWKVNGINVLVVASKTGVTDVWLNEGHILSSNNTAWTLTDSAKLYIGCNTSLGECFSGKIYGIQKYPFVLSPIQIREIVSEFSNGQ